MSKLLTFLSPPRSSGEPPRISGRTPLGCALAYRHDPVGFLRRTQAEHGNVFTLNLAGLDITLIADPYLLGTYHAAEEHVLSARAAQADIGFDEVLGELNVEAADVHRRLFGIDRATWNGDLRDRLWTECNRAIDQVDGAARHSDLLSLMRMLATKVVLGAFIASEVTTTLPHFVDQYARFQDRLESAIAGALALPRWLSGPLLLRPVGRARQRLTRPLAATLSRCATPAPFLAALRLHLGSDEEALRQAQVSIGLLFAAYKNPSIAAAQTILMLSEHPVWFARVRSELAGRPSPVPNLRELPHLEWAIRETLRLCALPIGSLRRVVGRQFSIGGYALPVGRFIGASHILMSMRSDAWPQPQRFDPQRFAPERREHTAVPHAWIPFSNGVHGCPGYRVALDFIASLVTAILDHFPALRPLGDIPPLDFERATLAQRAGRCPVALR